MLFNSFVFLYLFLPITYFVFWRLRTRNARYVWLAITGYVFYAFWNPKFCLLMALWVVGGTHVTLHAFTPLAMLQALERERIHTTVIVPTMVQMMVDHPQAAEYDLSALRSLAYGGSPISEAVLGRAMKLMPRVDFMQAYGMT